MKLKIDLNSIYLIIITLFFFFWGVNLEIIGELSFLSLDTKTNNFLSNNFRFSYLIILLIIPIFYKIFKEKKLSFIQIFNYQNSILLFALLVVAHFFLVKIYYNELIDKIEIINLIYFFSLAIIYCHYRNLIFDNFYKLLLFFLAIFVFYSIFEGSQIYNVGQCNADFFLISFFNNYLSINFTNSIFLENSHLAMMLIAVFFSSLSLLINNKIQNTIFISLFIISIIITLNNLSTTFFVGYFISQITLLLFFYKRISRKYWIITTLFLLINSYIFLADKNCTVKITDFEIQDIQQNLLKKNDTNMTTLIYQRSIIVVKETLFNHTFGWGMDGMDNANRNLLKNYNNNTAFWQLNRLNIKDGLSNFLKLFTEFGIFAFIIYIYFVKYILNLKIINSYNLFIIVLFITLSIRGAGYFNGGFIFCLFEFFYFQENIVRHKIKKQLF